eukprot:g5875.t1
MPATLSKAALTAEEEKEKKARDRQLLLVKIHCMINMAVSMMNFTSRGEFLKEVLGGDFSQVAWYLSTWTSVTAAIEFILNPTLGKLSDAYGRKPFMVLAPYAAIVLKSWVLMAPSVFSLTVERIVCDGLRTMSGTTMGSAAITDIVPKDQIGKAMSGLWSWMGLAIIGAPLLASRLSTRGTYQVAILVALGQLVADQFYLKETLKKEEMKPFPGFANPFEVFRMWTSGKLLATTSTLTSLQFMMDPKVLADFWIILQLDTLKWSRENSQLFTGFVGLGLVFGRKFTSWGLDKYGEHGFTTLTHAISLLESLIIGLFPSSISMFITGLLGFGSGQKMNGVKQIITRVALNQKVTTRNFGKGELSGLLANLRAMMVAIAPNVYMFFYNYGRRNGMDGGAFIGLAFITIMAELVHRQLIGKLPKD